MKTFRNIRNEVEPVAVSLEKHVKELNNFSRRHRRAEEAKKKFSTEVLSLIFKRLKEEKNAEELMNVGDTLPHLTSSGQKALAATLRK